MEKQTKEENPQNSQLQDNQQENLQITQPNPEENQPLPHNQPQNPQMIQPQITNPNNTELNSHPKTEVPQNNINAEQHEVNPPIINEPPQEMQNNMIQMDNMNQMNMPEAAMTQQQINEQYMLQYQQQINQMVNNQEIPMNNYMLNYPQIPGQLTPDQLNYQRQMESNENKNIYDYFTNMKLYGIAFQNGNSPRLAISSLEKRIDNKIEILDLIDNDLKKVCEQKIGYPSTKVLWGPNKNKSSLLASSSDFVQIYEYNEEKRALNLQAKLTNLKSKYCGALTSFDWNVVNDSILGTASIDNTCTIWDLNKQSIKTQLIAHDKEVLDIQFGYEENIFISGGADGSVRLFDLRMLDHSTIIYETKGVINKIAWNLQTPNLIAALSLEKNIIYIFDSRMNINVSMDELNLHKEPVTGCVWAPDNPSQLCSVSEDCSVIISNIGNEQNNNVSYTAPCPINNVDWCKSFSEWIGITFNDRVQLLRK